jgi:SAM-dependent methyltransferase
MPSRLAATTLLSVLQPWSDVEEPIHRRLAQLVDAEEGREALWVGCGSGRSVLWWSERFRTITEGIDPDVRSIEQAEERARGAGLAKLATFQTADPTNLPHEDQVFDTVIVHMLHLPHSDGEKVIGEAARVCRPMGTVVALVPSWSQSPLQKEAQIIQGLGLSPYVSVEWKSFFRDAGVVELSVEEAATDGGWILQRRFSLIVRGWRAAGWQGVRAVLGREVRTLCRLARRRVLRFSIIKGTRWPHG